MKTTRLGQEAQEPTSSLETVKMTIDESSIDVLMSNLTNLYSDPVIAILREYSSNAIDSHARAGQSQPIEITTPKGYGDPLVVRDFGVGMSKDEIANVYSRYGLSTKTNNNSEIGGFGLGCKSALAVADRFDIISVKDGIKTTAFIQKNIKGVGVVHFVSEEATEESNGLTVSIPMSGKGLGKFNINDMTRFFSGMPSGSVKLDGNILPTSYDEEWNQLEIAGTRVGAYYSKVNGYYNSLILTVGGVNYSADPLSNNPELHSFKSKTSNYQIIIDLPIGSVDLTPSRESLMLTERTQATISSAVKNVEAAIIESVASRINAAPSLKDAVSIYYEERQRGFWERTFNYRGKSLIEDLPLAYSQRIYRSETEKRKAAYFGNIKSINIFDGFGIQTRSQNSNILFIEGKTEQAELVSKSIYYYMMATTGTGKVNAILFDKDELSDSVFKSMVDNKAVSVDTIIAVAEKYRSDSRKASLAATKAAKANGVAVVSKTATFPTWDLSEDSLMVKPFPTVELQKAKVAYIHGSESISQLRRIFPTLGWHYEQGGVKLYENNHGTLAIIKMALPEYKIVFLGSQRSTAKFLEVVPNAVDAGAVLQSYADKISSEYRDALIAYSVLEPNGYGSRGASQGTYFIGSMAKLFSQYGMIGKISNTEVSESIISFLSMESETKKISKNLINSWVKVPQDVIDEANEINDRFESIRLKLVLLHSAHLTTEEQARHAIDYINMVLK